MLKDVASKIIKQIFYKNNQLSIFYIYIYIKDILLKYFVIIAFSNFFLEIKFIHNFLFV